MPVAQCSVPDRIVHGVSMSLEIRASDLTQSLLPQLGEYGGSGALDTRRLLHGPSASEQRAECSGKTEGENNTLRSLIPCHGYR